MTNPNRRHEHIRIKFGAVKKIVLCICALYVFGASLYAQNGLEALRNDSCNSFACIEARANEYFKDKPLFKREGLPWVDGEFVRYKRWHHFNKTRLMPDGSFVEPMHNYNIYMQYQNRKQRSGGVWENISQLVSESGYDGMGRVTSIAFHPTDSNILYITAPKGGVWKSTDGGKTWTAKGEKLPTLATGKIIIDPFYPNTLYITTNDRPGWWRYGIGIYKSIDGGDTWYPTGKTHTFQQKVVIEDLQHSPLAPNTLFSCGSDGIWRSVDSGATWAKVYNKEVNQIEFMPGNPQVMFASTNVYYGANQMLKSTDSGKTWVAVTSWTQLYSTIHFAVCDADSNVVYAAVNFSNTCKLYKSTDAGSSYALVGNVTPNDYIIVSRQDAQKVYFGEVVVHRSTNGGQSASPITHWYNAGILPTVHADVRYIASSPHNPNLIYFCNDGGVYKYYENQNNWKDISDGLVITQFYKIACAQDDNQYVIGGTQDNGGRQRTGFNTWTNTNGGDAMQQAIHAENSQLIYTTYVYGQLYRSYDRWTNSTYYDISPSTTDDGDWVAPYELCPVDNSIIYCGYSDVYRSFDEGSSWAPISNNLTGSNNINLLHMACSHKNRDMVFVSTDNRLLITRNGGTNWKQHIVSNVGVSEQISGLAVHPYRDSTTYYTKSGYQSSNKVFRSINGGSTYANITYNLPNVPVNAIIIDKLSDSANVDIYVATDVGVFYKKDKDTLWEYWGTGLPNTECLDLDIQYATGTLYVGTYGRGIWQTKTKRLPPPAGTLPSVVETTKVDCTVLQNQLVVTLTNAANGTLNLFDIQGALVQTYSLGQKTVFDTSAFAKGIYIAVVTIDGKQYKQKIKL